MDNSVKEILCDEWMRIVKSVFVNLGVFEPLAKTKCDIKLIYFLLCMRKLIHVIKQGLKQDQNKAKIDLAKS